MDGLSPDEMKGYKKGRLMSREEQIENNKYLFVPINEQTNKQINKQTKEGANLKTNEEIENAIRNYHWLIKEITRLKGELGMIGNPLMNKSEPGHQKQGRPANPTLNEVIRRETRLETLKKFQEKVEYVEKNTLVISDDREMTVLNCLLDGMNISNISRHMGYSKRTIYSIKEEIVEKVKAYAEKREQPSA